LLHTIKKMKVTEIDIPGHPWCIFRCCHMKLLSLQYFIILVICGLATGSALQAQDPVLHPESGRSLMTNFTPADYEAEPMNWAFIEDDRGIIYVGNNSGLLEYDGITWRLVSLPNLGAVRSLARDATGRIWVGGQGEVGYLTSDSLGRTVFVTLLEKFPEAHRNFQDVWETYATDEGIYFRTNGAILRWDGSTMKAWPAENPFHVSFVVNDTFYVRQFGVGLLRMQQSASGEALRLAPSGERFANTRIYVMLRFDAEQILIGTREEGLFLYDGELVKAFTTEADLLLAEGGLYLPGVVLPNGHLGLGTLSKGLVVINRAGRLVEKRCSCNDVIL